MKIKIKDIAELLECDVNLLKSNMIYERHNRSEYTKTDYFVYWLNSRGKDLLHLQPELIKLVNDNKEMLGSIIYEKIRSRRATIIKREKERDNRRPVKDIIAEVREILN